VEISYGYAEGDELVAVLSGPYFCIGDQISDKIDSV
jgi:hypothetical protein